MLWVGNEVKSMSAVLTTRQARSSTKPYIFLGPSESHQVNRIPERTRSSKEGLDTTVPPLPEDGRKATGGPEEGT